jgi:ferric-dicitrate binding protein FerR (iron transport regulator)
MTNRELAALARVAREASELPAPRPDWAVVEARLFAEVARQTPPHRVFGRPAGLSTAFGFALAAAVLLALGGLAPAPPSAALASGVTYVDRAALSVAELSAGDVVEARDAPLSLAIEGGEVVLAAGSRVTLRRTTKGAVRLELERGRLEAEVPPQAQAGLDEALVIDCGATRVAVHGTHFFVERHPDEVRVRVTRGSVAVGASGRVGPTLGWLLVAPAEGAFSPNGARAARWLSPGEWEPEVRPLAKPALPAAASGAAVPPEPALPEPVASSSPTPAAAGDALPWIGEPQIGERVRACLRGALPDLPAGVVFSTTARPVVDTSRRITAIRFDPPLHPAARSCAFVAGRLRGAAPPGAIAIEYRGRVKSEP